MFRMGDMHTAGEKKSDPPQSSSGSFSKQQISIKYGNFYDYCYFHLLVIVENVYVNLNETSPML